MKIIVFGGDGFCGWPTTLGLASKGHEVAMVDNLSRRKIDKELGTESLTDIASVEERVAHANALIGKVTFHNIDIARDTGPLRELISSFKPDTVVQFAEQRAAPYSMLGDVERRYTVDNNISGTHNICSAIVDIDPDIHLVHLGTMGVYGYSKAFGPIPEGYLNVNINATDENVDILYPANPGSVYHMTKCLDQLIFQFYNKNWGLKVTDLHQGIVWGVNTELTSMTPELVNRFDYDGLYGTVLNRFLVQAVQGIPLTVYGTGGQRRAFIHISDTVECVSLAAENPPGENTKVRIFNQVSEVCGVLAENELEVSNHGLRSLGFEPIKLSDKLIEDVQQVAKQSDRFDQSKVLNSPKW
jgi:UDP-sulfoquinovose synthase